jgi:calmodulin
LNENEIIGFNEYLSIAMKKIKNNNEDIDYMEAFKAFDRDGDGFISAKELKFVMETLGETMTLEEAEEMLKEADSDEDHRINYEEFLRMMIEK